VTGGSGTVVVVVGVGVASEVVVESKEPDAPLIAPPAPPHAARSNETANPAARRRTEAERRKRTAME
jgi:hypothetical protein